MIQNMLLLEIPAFISFSLEYHQKLVLYSIEIYTLLYYVPIDPKF